MSELRLRKVGKRLRDDQVFYSDTLDRPNNSFGFQWPFKKLSFN